MRETPYTEAEKDQLLIMIGSTLEMIAEKLVDEGDRVYLGNHMGEEGWGDDKHMILKLVALFNEYYDTTIHHDPKLENIFGPDEVYGQILAFRRKDDSTES